MPREGRDWLRGCPARIRLGAPTGCGWELTGTYDGKAVVASAVGVYHPAGGSFGTVPGITWTTALNIGGEEVQSTGSNTMSIDEAPRMQEDGTLLIRGWSWKNAWKAVRQVASWVQRNGYEITTVADQALTVIALPTPVTVATLAGHIDARMRVDTNTIDRLAVGSISGGYLLRAQDLSGSAAQGFSGSATMGQAPEPSSLLLVGLALGALGMASRVRPRLRC